MFGVVPGIELCFVLGFTTVFVGLGAGASAFGQLIQAHKSALSMIAGVVIVAFGLHFLGLVRIPLLYREARYHASMDGVRLIGAYVIGLSFAFGWTPCVGPVLAGVLALAAPQGGAARASLLLLCYSLGLGIPFLLAGLGLGRAVGALGAVRRRYAWFAGVAGVAMVAIGGLVATDRPRPQEGEDPGADRGREGLGVARDVGRRRAEPGRRIDPAPADPIARCIRPA